MCDTYIVEGGDTISSISSQFNVLECGFPAAPPAVAISSASDLEALVPRPHQPCFPRLRSVANLEPKPRANSLAPVPPAADLQDALTKCIRGYTPGVFLQPRQIICLPPWYDACANVVTAGEVAGIRRGHPCGPAGRASEERTPQELASVERVERHAGCRGGLETAKQRRPPRPASCVAPMHATCRSTGAQLPLTRSCLAQTAATPPAPTTTASTTRFRCGAALPSGTERRRRVLLGAEGTDAGSSQQKVAHPTRLHADQRCSALARTTPQAAGTPTTTRPLSHTTLRRAPHPPTPPCAGRRHPGHNRLQPGPDPAGPAGRQPRWLRAAGRPVREAARLVSGTGAAPPEATWSVLSAQQPWSGALPRPPCRRAACPPLPHLLPAVASSAPAGGRAAPPLATPRRRAATTSPRPPTPWPPLQWPSL